MSGTLQMGGTQGTNWPYEKAPSTEHRVTHQRRSSPNRKITYVQAYKPGVYSREEALPKEGAQSGGQIHNRASTMRKEHSRQEHNAKGTLPGGTL